MTDLVDRDVLALDDPVSGSLDGEHAHLARRRGRAAAYAQGVATFATVPPDAGPADWAGLAELLGPGELADLFACAAVPPPDWEPAFRLEGRQMVWSGAAPSPGEAGADVVELGADDVDEMLGLIARTRPGPFWPRTRELGTYLGIREHGTLVAMAGERLRPPGWTEISAVCTAPEARGRGHAARLVRALVARITARGAHPFLHVAEENAGAIALYERLGFTTRKRVTFRGFRVP
ncbi:GNAT family N-acetyltransferase [Streptomyces tagetis]|uniref:GNAT family N-acetyltransferase n=1 Tax=Streptomyces tagetis TaxID=2820809 RepID=A0A940XDE5_9ACTN|nr:GNAT family N-acetyltransferase [Streptomyces sp. RG38]MBQ0825137.1 GNAT family N-acetyltransferase [Streptomyces sp. RG38]